MISRIRQWSIYKKLSPLARASLWVILIFLLLNALFIPVFQIFMHVSFRTVESADVRNKTRNGLDVLQNEIDEIGTMGRDYAVWTAMYEFLQTRDMAFIAENFDENSQKNLNINLFAVIDTSGKIVISRILDFSGDNTTPVSFDVGSLLKKYPEITGLRETDGGAQGLVSLDGRIILVSSLPILTSQRLGPARGTLVFGRFLDAREDQNLTRSAHFDVFSRGLDAPILSDEMNLAAYELTGRTTLPVKNPRPFQCSICHTFARGGAGLAASNTTVVLPVNDRFLGGYTLLFDLQQTPIAIMGIHIPREFEQLETRNAALFLLSFVGLLVIIGVLGVIILTRNIQSEEALDREYKLLRSVIDNVPEQIYAHDTGGRYLLNNLCDAQMMGVDNPEDLLGKNDFDYYPPELAAQFQASELRVIQTGQAMVEVEGSITGRDGKQRRILTTKTPLRDSEGKIMGIVGVSRDITVRKQRERELEAIVTMSRTLRSAETSTELLFMIYKQVIEMLQANWGTVELIDPVSGDARVAYSYGSRNSLVGMLIPAGKGLNSHIQASQKPYLDNNLADNPMASDILVNEGCKAVAGAPLIAEEELIGFLWMGRKSDISEEELRLLATIADIAASSIHRMALHELTEKRLRQLVSLRKIDTSINNSKDLNTTIGVILDQTLSQLQADAADVLLLASQDSAFLENKFWQGFTTPAFDHHLILVDDSPAGAAVKNKELVRIPDLTALGPSHSLAAAAGAEGLVSYFAMPLLARGETRGVLEVYFRNEFNPDHDWINFLETLAGQAAIAIEQVQLFNGLQHSNRELVKAYDETIEGWVRALDLRDKETEGHSKRVCEACVELAAAMGISGEALIHVRRGALLHDIGKVGIPDHILLKPGALTDEEWVIMRGHPRNAYEMLSPINYLHPALSIPYCHHEKWDGSGYPRGLKGGQIPLEARIFAVIDVWDALRSDRPYRLGWPEEKVREYIGSQAGIHFDPEVVRLFLNLPGKKPA